MSQLPSTKASRTLLGFPAAAAPPSPCAGPSPPVPQGCSDAPLAAPCPAGAALLARLAALLLPPPPPTLASLQPSALAGAGGRLAPMGGGGGSGLGPG
eukprot:CAMPEP_0173425164 /NCGR_PEP_ID=MMETSP1357-20121228/4949_1 /TAXON_ID=77926 /ORGANISM="Hemiselmis rufescens, Strain PCC563" /LENGTH=97 /DNA_ID=CAMNT_0014388557 /DNA_START=84 /DNA_END=378 /DNA_ORIENTATION=+